MVLVRNTLYPLHSFPEPALGSELSKTKTVQKASKDTLEQQSLGSLGLSYLKLGFSSFTVVAIGEDPSCQAKDLSSGLSTHVMGEED